MYWYIDINILKICPRWTLFSCMANSNSLLNFSFDYSWREKGYHFPFVSMIDFFVIWWISSLLFSFPCFELWPGNFMARFRGANLVFQKTISYGYYIDAKFKNFNVALNRNVSKVLWFVSAPLFSSKRYFSASQLEMGACAFGFWDLKTQIIKESSNSGPES